MKEDGDLYKRYDHEAKAEAVRRPVPAVFSLDLRGRAQLAAD